MFMASMMTSQHDVKVCLLYSYLNAIVTFSHECFDIASQNFIHRCILAKYIALLIFNFKGPITRSPGHMIGQMCIEG